MFKATLKIRICEKNEEKSKGEKKEKRKKKKKKKGKREEEANKKPPETLKNQCFPYFHFMGFRASESDQRLRKPDF